MKTAFNLLPVADELTSMHLLIEVGWYGVSYCWYRKEPFSVHGILSYNFNDRITASDVASNLDYINTKEPVFTQEVRSTVVFYNFRESVLVPGKYAKVSPDAKHLDLMYGDLPGCLVRRDKVHFEAGIGIVDEIHNIFRVPESVHRIFIKRFPSATFIHSSSKQLDQVQGLQCIVYHNCIKIILITGDKLQLAQQFHYKAPEDVAYHLLNVCDKYDIRPDAADLMLSGMIDAQSNLYQELYKYFLNTSFVPVHDEVFLSSEIRAFPSHFFNHLTRLARCVS